LKKFFPNAQLEILTGLTVALALVPEAIAFSFVAKVDPLVGVFAAVIVCLITSLFGGRPGMISGATGAMAVVMTSLVVQHGVQHLFAAIVLAGIFQVSFGLMRWGKFVHLIPLPVTIGFVNGLALVIGMAQLEQFRVASPGATRCEWSTRARPRHDRGKASAPSSRTAGRCDRTMNSRTRLDRQQVSLPYLLAGSYTCEGCIRFVMPPKTHEVDYRRTSFFLLRRKCVPDSSPAG